MTDEAQDQQSEGVMNPSNAKLAAAAMGGYVLGRTKKGKQAIRLAMWLNGSKSPGPRVLEQARTGVSSVLASEQGQQILGQIKGPLLEAARQAAIQVAMNRVSALSKGLATRTQKLNEVTNQAGDKADETVSGATDKGEETVSDTTDQVDGALSELTGKSAKNGQAEDSAEEADEDDEEQDTSAGDGQQGSAEAEEDEADEDEDEDEDEEDTSAGNGQQGSAEAEEDEADEDDDEAEDEPEEQPRAKKQPAKTAKKKEPSNA